MAMTRRRPASSSSSPTTSYVVRVGRLTLGGVPARDRRAVGDAFSRELRRLLLDAGEQEPQPRPGTAQYVGMAIARNVHARLDQEVAP
jgi:hypothetical protein